MKRALLLMSALALLSLPAQAEEEAVTVFAKISPSVVALEGLLGNGTGVILDQQGTILTNAHVVSIPVGFKCKVEVGQGASARTLTYTSVTLVGVHPTRDLAIVRINPQEHNARLAPASLAKQRASQGQTVYAIGNPSSSGVELTKTITAGLLSGVNRVIEGVAYYQTDAAVNPGNSGGPLCDRKGDVLGLVTLKFTDVESVGFAIPLHDLRLDEFKPPSARASDPAKAAGLIVKGNEMASRYADLKRRSQQDTLAAALFKKLALQYFFEALVHDASNGAVYCSIARWLREDEEHDAAESFLLHAIEMSPWPKDSQVYRELGLQLMRMKRPDDAEAVWREGVAKFPVQGAQIWEDLSIHYRDRSDWMQCAMCAAAQLEIGKSTTRQDFARAVLDRCRQRETDPARREQMNERIQGAGQELRRRVHDANKALIERNVALTQPFADFMARRARRLDAARITALSVEGLPADGIGNTAQAPRAAPSSPVTSTDLLAALSVSDGRVEGDWQLQGGALLGKAASYGRIRLSASQGDEYDLDLRIERKAGQKELVLGLTRGGRQSLLLIDYGGTRTGIFGVSAGVHAAPVLPAGKKVDVIVHVRRDSLVVTADGREVFVHRGGPLPAVPQPWEIPDKRALFLGIREGEFAIERAVLIEVGAPLVETLASSNANMPSLPARPAAAGTAAQGPTLATAAPARAANAGASAVASPPLPARAANAGASAADSPPLPVGAELARIPLSRYGANSLAISPDGSLLAVGKMDGTLQMVNVERRAESGAYSQRDAQRSVGSACFTPDGKLLLTGGNGVIQIWSVYPGGALVPERQFAGHTGDIEGMAFSPDGAMVLSGGADQRVRCWDLQTARESWVQPTSRAVKACAFSADGATALVCDGQTLLRFDARSGRKLGELKVSAGYSNVTAFSQDGSLLAVQDSRVVRVFAPLQGREIAALPEPDFLLRRALFSPDGKHLFLGNREAVAMWDVASQQKVKEFLLPTANATADFLAITRDGAALAVASRFSNQGVQVFRVAP